MPVALQRAAVIYYRCHVFLCMAGVRVQAARDRCCLHGQVDLDHVECVEAVLVRVAGWGLTAVAWPAETDCCLIDGRCVG